MKFNSMRHEPNHTCLPSRVDCAGCAFELGASLAKKKPTESAKYVWMIVGSDNPCDIRRYEFTHRGSGAQLEHAKKRKRGYKDDWSGGVWTLFKLVQVNKKEVNERKQK